MIRKINEREDFEKTGRGGRLLDEYEAPELESSSDESTFDEPSLDEPSSGEENPVDNGDEENTYERLGDNDGGVLLDAEDHSFRPIWNDNIGGYLREMRGCGSSTTKKRERRRERELEKSTTQTRSIVEMFSVKRNKGLFHHKDPISGTTPAISVPEIMKKGGRPEMETIFEA